MSEPEALPAAVDIGVTPILDQENGRPVEVEIEMTHPVAILSLDAARQLAGMLLRGTGDAFHRPAAAATKAAD